MKKECTHAKSHNASVSITHLVDSGRFVADVKVECAECGRPFQFVGLPLGMNLDGAAMSVDGQTASLGLVPVGTVPQPLDGFIKGFRVRMPGDH